MSCELRTATEQDWETIRALVSTLAPGDEASNADWFRQRTKFDTTRYVRKHYIALEVASRQVVGYGAIEQGPGVLHYRIFLAVQPETKESDVWQLLFARLMDDLRELKAAKVWARELGDGNHSAILGFLRANGFDEVNRAQTKNAAGKEVEIVRLERNLL